MRSNVAPLIRAVGLDSRLQRVMDTIPVGVTWSELKTGRIEYMNRYMRRMLGYALSDFETVMDFVAGTAFSPEIAELGRQRQESFQNLTANEAMELPVDEVPLKCKDGSIKIVLIGGILLPDAGWYVATFIDITEQKMRERQVTRLSQEDPLTGVMNRRSFDDALKEAIDRLADKEKFFVLIVDLDGFKSVNDTSGHLAGDDVLIESAKRMRGALRKGDVLARLGGDEFAAILTPPVDEQQANEIVARVEAAFENPFTVDHGVVRVGISAGLACYPDDAQSERDLFRLADNAMYAAKVRHNAVR